MIREKSNISFTILQICIRIVINFVLIFVLVQGFATTYDFSYRLFMDIPYKAASADLQEVTIVDGSSASDVAVLLEEKGIVESRYMFLARAYIGKYQDDIIAGMYMLGPGMSPETICKKICGIQSEETS